MYRPRIIPVLLLMGSGLVKTIRFSRPTYIGDPINAVRIFNDLRADELVFLDIRATLEGRSVSSDLIKKIGDEAFMPFSVGGGITRLDQIKELLSYGAEKVILNSVIHNNLELISKASKTFGNQSIIASIDVKKNLLETYKVYNKSGMNKISLKLSEYILDIEKAGAGEILINSIDKDGTYSGYDIELIKEVTKSVSIPVIACGGAGSLNDFSRAFFEGGANACAAGSLFVYHGPRRAVLINYPEKKDILDIFKNAI